LEGRDEYYLREDIIKKGIRVNFPESFDWRDHGAVSEVKRQKDCGACYAFGTLAAIESHHFIQTGKLYNLSVQEL
jgi:cathepsin F